jgi:alkylresorcinol/alkylpyrone synthase
MSVCPRLIAVATAVPEHRLPQEEVARQAVQIFRESREAVLRMTPVYANSGVAERYSCVPAEWFEADHPWSQRNRLYVENAIALLEVATERCLRRAGRNLDEVGGIVLVSTTGIATPSLDALLIDRLAMRRDVRRLPIFGLGCAGGVIGLTRAAAMAKAEPGTAVLFVVCELCGLTFRRADQSKSNMVATALFGDGAAAALIDCTGNGPILTAGGEHTWPDSLDVMGWGVEDDGLRVIFSRDIPTLIRRELRPALDGFLARCGLTVSDIDTYLCHPGGAKVLDALEDVLGLAQGSLAHSRGVLRDFGNMSAATVLFVLERTLADGAIGGRALLSALGPGFTVGFQLVESP